MRIESVDLNLLDKDTLISFYTMEYDLSMTIVDKLINIDKINYIKKNMMRYHLDKNYKTEIDKYNTGGLELNVCLGKYYDEFKKNQKHNNLRIQKSNVLKRKLEDLNNDIITKNNNCFLKFCYKDDKLVVFIEYEKRDDEFIKDDPIPHLFILEYSLLIYNSSSLFSYSIKPTNLSSL